LCITRLCKPPAFTTCARDHPTDSISDPHDSLTPCSQVKMAAALDISFSRRCSRCRLSSTSSKGRARAACRSTGSCAHLCAHYPPVEPSGCDAPRGSGIKPGGGGPSSGARGASPTSRSPPPPLLPPPPPLQQASLGARFGGVALGSLSGSRVRIFGP